MMTRCGVNDDKRGRKSCPKMNTTTKGKSANDDTGVHNTDYDKTCVCNHAKCLLRFIHKL